MFKIIASNVCAFIFLSIFSGVLPVKASDDLSNVHLEINSNQQPIVTGLVSSRVAGTIIIFDHLGSDRDFTVSVSQEYPAQTFTTESDCFSPPIGGCQTYLPSGLYQIRIVVSDQNLQPLETLNLSQKLLVNSSKTELFQAESASNLTIQSPPVSSPPPKAFGNSTKAITEIKEAEKTLSGDNNKSESTEEIRQTQVKGVEIQSNYRWPNRLLLIILYISFGLCVCAWGLYFLKRSRSTNN